MSSAEYYKKYWDNSIHGDRLHAVKTPNWPIQELTKYYDEIKEFIGLSILDIGCGDGEFLKFIKPKINKKALISGVDISEVAVKKCRALLPDSKFETINIEDGTNFKSGEFDTVFMNDAIEHLLDVNSALEEINRVLKKGGKIILITPDFNILKKIIIATFFWEKFFNPLNPHIRFFTLNSLNEIMSKNGFSLKYYKWGLTWFGIMPQNSYFVYEKK